MPMTHLLRTIFNHEFTSAVTAENFAEHFFAKTFTLSELHEAFKTIHASSYTLAGNAIPAAIEIKGSDASAPPLMLVAQLHGNEPAGLAAITLCIALSQAGLLKRNIVGVIGNPLAAKQYFEHRLAHPDARQEVRDAYRCGLSDSGALLADLNRIPVDFRQSNKTDHHTLRARELYALGEQAWGVADIHTARGNMVCITDYKHESELKGSPIRAVLTHLADAIAANAAATVSVQTLKTILAPLDNIKAQIGIEAGRHEDPKCPEVAASFTLSLLSTLGMTDAKPHYDEEEDGVFKGYAVQPRITYADLKHSGTIPETDEIYMVRRCQQLTEMPDDCSELIVKTDSGVALQTTGEYQESPAGSLAYAPYQYDEMEAITHDQVVALAVPSGIELKAHEDFSGIFFSKAKALYDIDPSVGPWPIKGDQAATVKFCYPCKVGPFKPDFSR